MQTEIVHLSLDNRDTTLDIFIGTNANSVNGGLGSPAPLVDIRTRPHVCAPWDKQSNALGLVATINRKTDFGWAA